jgi:hypothetical protein
MATEVASLEKTTAKRAPAQTFRWILLAVSIGALIFLGIMAAKWPFMRSKMRMLATVSQATTGAKSVFLKILDPFYKKKKKGAGAEVPIRMTGTYGHTHFTAGLK